MLREAEHWALARAAPLSPVGPGALGARQRRAGPSWCHGGQSPDKNNTPRPLSWVAVLQVHLKRQDLRLLGGLLAKSMVEREQTVPDCFEVIDEMQRPAKPCRGSTEPKTRRVAED